MTKEYPLLARLAEDVMAFRYARQCEGVDPASSVLTLTAQEFDAITAETGVAVSMLFGLRVRRAGC